MFAAICFIFFVNFALIKTEITHNATFDSLLDGCAGNNTEFLDCKSNLQDLLNATGVRIDVDLHLKYHSGQLMTWAPVNRTAFVKYCGLAPKIDECLNVPGVRKSCQDEFVIKLFDMFSYFCQTERRDKFLDSLECVWRIDTWYEADRCVKREIEKTSIGRLKSEVAVICRVFAAALVCSESYIVKDCGQNTFDYMHKASEYVLKALDAKCDLKAEVQKRK